MSQPLNFTIRLGQLEDIPELRVVEASAASIFLTIPALAHHASDGGLSQKALANFIDAQELFVAVTDANQPIGFLVRQHLSSTASYIAELSVSASHQRMGVGKALLGVLDSFEHGEITSLVLTTYKYVSWNGPFYKRQGFVELDLEEWEKQDWGPALRKIEDGERGERGERNFEGGTRCVMCKKLQVHTV